jgi:hypothetical protein
MLSFDSSLSTSLNKKATESFWVLKLYYNAEGSSDFIGVSDQTRIDGSDTYHGIVTSFGNLIHSLDFFNFKASTMNMTVSLVNTPKTIGNERFSDLFATKNFANRKWELFQNTDSLSTFDTAARMIGTGIISGDISYDHRTLSLKLLDLSSARNKKIPSAVIQDNDSGASNYFPNAPEKNIGKPIPMAYGDFFEKTDIGTIPTTHFDRFKNFYKGAFPAIITDKFDVGEGAVEAHVDSKEMHTLDSENVYYYKNALYPTITGTVDATSNNPKIEFSGARCKVYLPLSTSGFTTSGTGTHTNEESIANLDFSDTSVTTISCNSGDNVTVNYALPTVTKLGEYVGITALTKFGTVSGSMSGLNQFLVGNVAYTAGSVVTNAELSNSIASVFSGDTSSWNFEGTLAYKLLAGADNGNLSVQVIESGIVVEFDIDDIETYEIEEEYEQLFEGGYEVVTQFDSEIETFSEVVTMTRTNTFTTPAKIDYVYCSGKGRIYGDWIDNDSRNQGYNEDDLIENPVYIIEDVLRSELSLATANIDVTTFDASGNTTNGHIGDIYSDAVSDIKFSFSQNKFINSRDLINRISKQILSWVFLSGNGKYKIKTLRRTSDYSSANRTIDFNDIQLDKISLTPIGNVRNDITISFAKDYGQNQFLSSVNPSVDSTSSGTTVNGNNQTLKLEMDADIIDTTTATKLAEAYREIFKNRKEIISFSCLGAKNNDLEIGDIILFSNWDSNIKIYGSAMGTDYYIIQSISKAPDGSKIKAIKVS